jgi:hypothetical protein
MSECIRIGKKGFITLSKIDFNCPACNQEHGEKFYYNQLRKSKNCMVYKECKKCGEILGITHDMCGDVVVWLKKDERTHGPISLKPIVQLVLDWIIAQNKGLDQYYDFEEPLKQGFIIKKDGKEATREFIEEVIRWEMSSDSKTLEKTLTEKFTFSFAGV